MYDAASVRSELEPHRPLYEAKLREGQPERWKADQRTTDLFCLGRWLNDVLTAMPDITEARRIQMLWYFNRTVRAEDDPFEVAAVVMNTALTGRELEPHYQTYSRRPRT